MYGQIYTLPFKSIEENDYLVVIEKDGFTGTSTELIGSTSPFTMETSLDNPLSPYRLSTATLKIFGGDYLQNLFTPNPQGVRVKLLKNGIVEWIGFVTNDVYSQDYSNIEFEYEIELVNPLSTLKYKKFVDNSTGIISFYQLIVDAIKETNSEIKKLYLSKSITNELNQNIYEAVSTASANYIDEQDEKMTYYEILEEIAKYLGLTITMEKDEVFFIDYLGISKGYNQYYEYTFDSSYAVTKATTPITLSETNTIQILDYSGSSSTLQINSGKNKAKVTCSLYNIEELLPEFNDEKSVFVSMEEKTIGKTQHIVRHFKQPKYTFYKYTNGVKTSPYINDEPILSSDTGASFVRTSQYNIDDKPTSLTFKNELIAKRYLWSDAVNSNYEKYITSLDKIFSVKSTKKHNINPDIYLLIGFGFLATNTIFPEDIKVNNKFPSNATSNTKVSLRIGNYYYNGTSWVTTASTFNIPTSVKEDDTILNTWKTPDNTNTFDLGLGGSDGFVIKTPSVWIYGDIELTIYMLDYPYNVVGLNTIGAQYIHLRDIEVRYGIPNPESIYNDWKDENSDIVYENVIEGDYVEEAEELELKICTFPDNYSKLCYSTTYIDSDFLRTLKYEPLVITDKPEIINLNKIVNYYSIPKYQVSVPVINKQIYPYTLITDSNLTGKKFIYAGNEIDYEYEKNTITLIEI